MSRTEIARFLLIRSLGNFLVLFALYGVFATFGPVLAAEVTYRIAQVRGVRYVVVNGEWRIANGRGEQLAVGRQQKAGNRKFSDVLMGEKEQILIPKDIDFSILIPKIGASAKVFPNVDPTSEQTFLPILQKGVAHARGSVFPGMKGNIYLFAHSTDTWWHVRRYNAIFYLLKDVSRGDTIILFFEGVRHDYVVSEKRILDPTDVSLLTNTQRNNELLVLQTCWPPGTTWKRLYVISEPKH